MQESPLDDDPVFSDTAVKPGSSMEGLVANKSTYVVPEKTQHSAPPVCLYSFFTVPALCLFSFEHYTAVKADVLLPLPNATTKPIRFNIIANSSMVITIKDARKVVDEFPSTAFLGFGAIGFTSLIKATMELFYLCLAMGVVHTIKFGTRFWFGLAMVYCSFVLADFQFAVADMFFTTAGGNGTTTMESIDVHSNWAKVPIWSFPIWICLLYSSFVLAVLGMHCVSSYSGCPFTHTVTQVGP